MATEGGHFVAGRVFPGWLPGLQSQAASSGGRARLGDPRPGGCRTCPGPGMKEEKLAIHLDGKGEEKLAPHLFRPPIAFGSQLGCGFDSPWLGL